MSKKVSQYWIFNHATVHYRKHIHLITFDIFSNPQVNWDEVCLQRKQSQKKVKPYLFFIKSINQLDNDETILIGAKNCKVFSKGHWILIWPAEMDWAASGAFLSILSTTTTTTILSTTTTIPIITLFSSSSSLIIPLYT